MSAKTTKSHRRVVTNAPLEDVVIFAPAISLWSGRGKLVAEDIGIDENLLPPQALASLGSKRLISKEDIKPIEKAKRKIMREIANGGLNFLNGFAFPRDRAEQKALLLDKLVREAEKVRDKFVQDFDAKAKAWQEKFPDWAHIISAALPTKEKLATKIAFSYQAFLAGKPEDKLLAKRLEDQAGGLAGTLWAEIESEAIDFVKKSFGGQRNSATQRTIKPVLRMVDKLDGLAFLDHRVGPLVDMLKIVLQDFPAKGKISDEMYLRLVRIGSLLADQSNMQAAGQRIFDGEPIEVVANDIVGAPLKVAGACTVAGDLMVAGSGSLSGTVSDDAERFFTEEIVKEPIQEIPVAAAASPQKGRSVSTVINF